MTSRTQLRGNTAQKEGLAGGTGIHNYCTLCSGGLGDGEQRQRQDKHS